MKLMVFHVVSISLLFIMLLYIGLVPGHASEGFDPAAELKRPAYMVLDLNAPRPEAAKGQPVPEFRLAPKATPRSFGIPSIQCNSESDGEVISLHNDLIALKICIDQKQQARIISLKTASGHEIISEPAPCFMVLDEKGGVVKDGTSSQVKSWMPLRCSSYSEVRLNLSLPERVVWHIRLYRDKPYLEQTFELPDEWRTPGRVVAQVLVTHASLKPVMPANVFGRGFSQGRPNIENRHRFEFLDQSDHLCYDAKGHFGLACFAAGIGGEERVAAGQLALLDHACSVSGASEPCAKLLLWPFDGPVETGFLRIRKFIADEYSCQADKQAIFSWNQFWLWQGGIQPANSEVVTSDRLLDILPHVAAVGCEEFHLDAGWQTGPGDWRFDEKRFPEGFEPLRKFLRERNMRYHTWMNNGAGDDPEFVKALIGQTDMSKLFHDRTVDEKTIAATRQIRREYPDFDTFVHHSTSRSKYYWWGNIHFSSDLNQVYFGEGEFWAWSNVLPEKPEGDVNTRFFSTHSIRAGDMVTRSAAYQVHWAWPYKSIMPPHCGWAWFEDRELSELSSRMFTTIAARYDYQWGFDPRMLRDDLLNFFLDWTAFFKTAKPYLQEYQHVLPVPDGIHPDGAAHVVDGQGFVILCNPGKDAAAVTLKDLLWEPELELDPARPVELTDWTKPLSPKSIQTVKLTDTQGTIPLDPLSYRVIGINIDTGPTLKAIKLQRSKLGRLRKE